MPTRAKVISQRAKPMKYERPDYHKFYGSNQWKKIRAMHIAEHPLCEECLKHGFLVPARIVDHIHEIKDGGSMTDFDNLQSLCQACHSKKTQEEKEKRERR